jgi:hypothetical protein
MRSLSISILVLGCLTSGSGMGCGSAQPLGTAQPPPEPDPLAPTVEAAPEPSESDAELSAWQASEEPLYVVTTRVKTTAEVYHSFLLTVPAIGPGTSFGLEQAVQVDTDSAAFGTRGQPYAYAASASQPTVTRWRLTAAGTIEQGPVVDFASLGMRRADAAGSLSFFSEEKAYFCNPFDPSQVAVWNPRSMSLIGSIPLDLPAQGPMRPQVVLSQRADRIFAIASWQHTSATDWTRFGNHVEVIAIDPTTDGVVGRVAESRCNSFSWVSAASDGTAYFSPAAYYAPLRRWLGDTSGVDSCALRITAGADQFEPGYGIDLEALTGGRPAGDLLLVSDETAFLRVWHSELVTPLDSVNSNWEAVLQEPGFLWWSWQLGSAEARQVPEQEPAADAQMFVVDGKTYTPALARDRSTSVLQELDPSAGELRPGLSGPGQIVGVFRIR